MAKRKPLAVVSAPSYHHPLTEPSSVKEYYPKSPDTSTEALPVFSVVVPCHNSLQYTIQAINSIVRNSTDYELILVNDGSSDETPDYLKAVAARATKDNKWAQGIRRVVVIHNQKALGYTVAANQGAAMAVADRIAICNSDIVVTAFWLDRMNYAMNTYPTLNQIGKIGVVGPATNYAAGRQAIAGLPTPFPMEQLDGYASDFYAQNQQNWHYTGFLSGYCFMVTRECWEAVGGLDERFTPGGFEDNDLIIRAYEAGFKALIAGDTFVYHYGSRTLTLPENSWMLGGLHNRGKYMAKHLENIAGKRQVVVCGMRVKNSERWLKASVEKSLTCCDYVVIMDDGSTDRTPEIIAEIQDQHEDGGNVKYHRYDRPFHEVRDRDELWQLMKSMPGACWGLILDGDEQLEDKIDDDYMQKLCSPVNVEIRAYVFKVINFWGGREKFRSDGIFGELRGVRLVKFAEDQHIWTPHPMGLHCGNTPLQPPEFVAVANVHIKHFGYEDREICQRKFEFYSNLDTVKDPRAVGGDGSYSHLVDETGLQLRDWVEFNTIGLCIIARNEAELLPSFFERQFLHTLFDQIVLVDSGSSDDTKLMASLYGAEVYDLPAHYLREDGRLKHFGKARNFARSKMETRWILVMDADEWMDRNNQLQLLRCLEDPVMAYITQVYNYQPEGQVSFSENFRLSRNVPELFYTQHVHESLEDSIRACSAATALLPFPLHHSGYLRGNQYVQGKLEHYEALNLLDLEADPSDCRPYFNLALHYMNDGKFDDGVAYLERSISLNPQFFQASKELGLARMRQAREAFFNARKLIPQTHTYYGWVNEITEVLEKYAGPAPIVGTGGGRR